MHPDEVTEEGIQVLEQVLRRWAQGTRSNGENVQMEDVTPEAQLEELRRCVEQFRARIEGNSWVQSMISSL